MATGTGTYHQQLAEQKRAAIIAAATGLFLAGGYAGTSAGWPSTGAGTPA